MGIDESIDIDWLFKSERVNVTKIYLFDLPLDLIDDLNS